MKKLLIIAILNFCLIIPSQADNIKDFQIEGMSLGDSLLKYLSKNEIDNMRHATNYKSKKYKTTTLKNFTKLYDVLRVSYKSNDKDYIIHGISGILVFERNINDCYKKKDKIVKEIKPMFTSIKEKKSVYAHKVDKTGKTKVTSSNFYFKNFGSSSVACVAYSDEMKKKNRIDHLRIGVMTNEYIDWLNNEAYK